MSLKNENLIHLYMYFGLSIYTSSVYHFSDYFGSINILDLCNTILKSETTAVVLLIKIRNVLLSKCL